jgi:hypothetical protein
MRELGEIDDSRIDLNDSQDGSSESGSSGEGSSHSFGSTSSSGEEIEENVNYDTNHGLDDRKLHGI